ASGVEPDGWLMRRSSFALAGGSGSNFVIHAIVPTPDDGKSQHLVVRVDGRTIVSQPVAPGALEISRPLGASALPRHVVIQWQTASRLGPNDPRRASARLTYLGVVPARGISTLVIPSGLHDPSVAYSGIFADGWAKQNVHLLVAGGRA